jgi:hypothetical protein
MVHTYLFELEELVHDEEPVEVALVDFFFLEAVLRLPDGVLHSVSHHLSNLCFKLGSASGDSTCQHRCLTVLN